ncbi:unnamed protein product [Dicrocoelium dendriticum]|nr:unnamed protein product [Dicrocoelium dendriticum]
MNCLTVIGDSTETSEVKEKNSFLKHQSEFAAICSFIHHFGNDLGVHLTFPQLLEFLTVTEGAHRRKWETLHVKLLNKLKFRARPERWETVLGRFLLIHASNVDGLADAAAILQANLLDVPGSTSARNDRYYDLDTLTRTKVFLSLLESQFDRNQSFKEKVNNRSPLELRFQPLGTDVWGQVYWLLKDSEVNILMYREDPEHQNIRLICESTDDIRALHNDLKDVCSGDLKLSAILAKRPPKSRSETPQSCDPFTPSLKLDPIKLEQCAALTPEGTEDPIAPAFIAPPSPVADNLGISEPIKAEEHTQAFENTSTQMNGIEQVLPHASSKGSPKHVSTGLDDAEDVTLNHSVEKTAMSAENSIQSAPPANSSSLDVHSTAETPKIRSSKVALKSETNDATAAVSSSLREVRRSGRQRKPVEFLTMEPLQPKRCRLNSTIDVSKQTHSDNTGVTPKRKRRTKKQFCDVGVADQNRVITAGKKPKRRRRKKRHRKSAASRLKPWTVQTSSSETDEDDDVFELALLEQHNLCDGSDAEIRRSPVKSGYCSDWLDKPESDFNPDDIEIDSDVDSLIHGRNLARQKRLQKRLTTSTVTSAEADPDEPCQICLKCDTPEWILLCDRCDLGHHAMCLYPPLFSIPEGDWFCPRCQHISLVTTLSQCADTLDAEQKKQTIWKRMQERLNYVNISMTNIIADKEDLEGDEVETNIISRGKRKRSSVAYRDSCSSAGFSTESFEGSSSSSYSDGEKWFGRRGPKTTRSQRPRRSAALGHAPLHNRLNYRSEPSSFESGNASSEEQLTAVSRVTRRRETHYNMNNAFKLLDEALEGDEKYQEEKRLRKSQKNNEFDGFGANCRAHLEADAHSEASSEKHVSNAPEPAWRDSKFGRIGFKARRRRRRRRISTSSSESGGTDSKIKAGDDDVDFCPSSNDACSQSDASETEQDEVSESTSSDKSWLCVSRQSRRISKKRKPVAKINRNYRGVFKYRKPIPRFEASASEEGGSEEPEGNRIFPKRRTRTVVKYDESEEEESDCFDNLDSKPSRFPDRKVCETRSSKTLDEDSDGEQIIQTGKPIGRRTRRCVLSSDSDCGPNEMRDKCANDNLLVDNSAVAPSENEPTDPLNGASLIKQEGYETVTHEATSEHIAYRAPFSGSPRQSFRNLAIKASSDEESVEEEADSLLPVRPVVPTVHSCSGSFLGAPQSPDLFDVEAS